MTCDRSVVFSGSLVSSSNKTDRHDTTEILLKVALNTIKQTFTFVSNVHIQYTLFFFFYKLSGEPVTVEGTVMNLNQPKKLKDVISLVPGNVGFDHCFCFSDAGWKKLRAKWVQCNSRNISLGLGIEIRANVVLTWVFNQIIEQKICILVNMNRSKPHTKFNC